MTGAARTIAGGMAALWLAAGASSVRAETTVVSQNPNAFPSPAAPGAPHKSLQLDANGSWTLRLDMEQPAGGPSAPTGWKDVQAGAYFHITPSLRIGGSVGLGDRQADVQRILPQDTTGPRVNVETKFKF